MPFLVILFFALLPQILATCPSGGIGSGLYCYYFNSNLTEFVQAEEICKKSGGHLASVSDAFTNDFLTGTAAQFFSQNNDFWIGLNALSSGDWEWTDKSTFFFKDWAKGQPTPNGQCATVSMTDEYWSVADCKAAKPFVCAVRKRPQVFTECSNGWDYWGITNSYYCYNGNPCLKWQDAENYCVQIGGHLPSIHNSEERDFVLGYARNDLSIGGDNPIPWIGLYTTNKGVSWNWTDNSTTDYFSWGSDQPDLSAGTCGSLFSFLFNNPAWFGLQNCNHVSFVVCKTDHIKSSTKVFGTNV